ncbi:sugar efflux transporter for intercellular exchange-domain-containing protein [Pavlovales sp. CCMP2436]|nr:sugar efflux transporter for intercellular exchange-domain-containing protein [Pavlovales sp. CCMP2436]
MWTYVLLHHVAPGVGSVLAQFLFLSPLKEVLDARERGSIGALNPWPFLFMCLNCMGWLVYAAEIRDWYVFLANLPGLLIGLWYVMQCLPLMKDRAARAKLEWALVISFGVWVTAGELRVLLLSEVAWAGDIFAWGTVAGLVMFYASPLSTLYQVVKNRDASSIQERLATLSFLNASLWSLYGLLAVNNYFIAGPNAVGVLLSTVQLGLRHRYSPQAGTAPMMYPAKEEPFSLIPGSASEFELPAVANSGSANEFELPAVANSGSTDEFKIPGSGSGSIPGSSSTLSLLPPDNTRQPVPSNSLFYSAAVKNGAKQMASPLSRQPPLSYPFSASDLPPPPPLPPPP